MTVAFTLALPLASALSLGVTPAKLHFMQRPATCARMSEATDPQAMRIKQIKEELTSLGVPHTDAFEKADLIQRLIDARTAGPPKQPPPSAKASAEAAAAGGAPESVGDGAWMGSEGGAAQGGAQQNPWDPPPEWGIGGMGGPGGGPPPVDESRRNRSPGISNNFYDTSNADFRRPHGSGPAPSSAPAGAAAGGGGAPQGNYQENPPYKWAQNVGQGMGQGMGQGQQGMRQQGMRRGPEPIYDNRYGPPANYDNRGQQVNRPVSTRGLYTISEEIPMPGREKEYEQFKQEQQKAEVVDPVEPSPYVPPPGSVREVQNIPRERVRAPSVDEARRNRSPGISNNFYDINNADFKRPYGMGGPADSQRGNLPPPGREGNLPPDQGAARGHYTISPEEPMKGREKEYEEYKKATSGESLFETEEPLSEEAAEGQQQTPPEDQPMPEQQMEMPYGGATGTAGPQRPVSAGGQFPGWGPVMPGPGLPGFGGGGGPPGPQDESLQKDMASLRSLIQQKDAMIADQQSTIESMQTRIDTHDTALQRVASEIDTLKKTNADLRDRMVGEKPISKKPATKKAAAVVDAAAAAVDAAEAAAAAKPPAPPPPKPAPAPKAAPEKPMTPTQKRAADLAAKAFGSIREGEKMPEPKGVSNTINDGMVGKPKPAAKPAAKAKAAPKSAAKPEAKAKKTRKKKGE